MLGNLLRFAFLKETHGQEASSDFGARPFFIKAGNPCVKHTASLADHIPPPSPATALGTPKKQITGSTNLRKSTSCFLFFHNSLLTLPKSPADLPSQDSALKQGAFKTPEPVSFLASSQLLLSPLQHNAPLKQKEHRGLAT